MPVSQADLDGRDIDLEKTYVHDVYNHMSALRYPGQTNGHRWPKVNQFLNGLEPGSIVCDVGCGSGKYLRVNSGIYKVGVDICKKLTQVAKEDDKEVILCDNLTLPFRDETFDAVLSIAVIHHFANPERRICALRELARILRVGGRLIITVWAMEQKHRKFPSQDVLVPCCQPQYLHNSSIEVSTSTTATSEEDFATPLRLSLQGYESDYIYPRTCGSLKQEKPRRKSRLHLFRSLRSIKTSPSSSNLSSPNETCYSFVRKAIQKLSRSGASKREKRPSSGTWFLDSLTSLNRDDLLPATRYDPEGCEREDDVQNIPIEIIRMEKDKNDHHPNEKPTAVVSYKQLLDVLRLPPQKSRSMNDIPRLEVLPASPRSRSSVSSIEIIPPLLTDVISSPSDYKNDISNNNNNNNNSSSNNINTLKPKLVKQKRSICEECDDQRRRSIVIIRQQQGEEKSTIESERLTIVDDSEKNIIESDRDEMALLRNREKSFNILKQRSLTDDIMSADRLKEKEDVRQNIQKQASLNDELIYRNSTTNGNRHKSSIDSLKEIPQSAARKFQLFRNGLTNKIKNSTPSIEKVTSIKSGFARIFHNLTTSVATSTSQESGISNRDELRKSSSDDANERRYSQNDENSDSSKDNSLQSDTSVDSEDSVVSVIERVTMSKSNAIILSSSDSSTSKLHHPTLTGVLSHPCSPKIAQTSLQYQNVHATKTKALSLPASPRNLISSSSNIIKQTFKIPTNGRSSDDKISTSNNNTSSKFTYDDKRASPCSTFDKGQTSPTTKLVSDEEKTTTTTVLLKLAPIDNTSETGSKLKVFSDKDVRLLSEKLTLLSKKTATNGTEPRDDICEGDESEKSDIEPDAITKTAADNDNDNDNDNDDDGGGDDDDARVNRKPSNYKIGSLPRSVYALVKRSTSGPGGAFSTHAARLPSYELFNPEIEDVETDSSGISTPDSVDSVISVKIEYPEEQLPDDPTAMTASFPAPTKTSSDDVIVNELPEEIISNEQSPSGRENIEVKKEELPVADGSQISSAQPVQTTTADPAEETTTRLDTANDENEIKTDENEEILSEQRRERPALVAQPSMVKSPADETWGNECRQYLVEFAENLSEKLLAEIDRYKEREKHSTEFVKKPEYIRDPYLTRLSEELHHVSKLSKELSQDCYDTKANSDEVRREIKLEELSTDVEKRIPDVSVEESEELQLLLLPSPTDGKPTAELMLTSQQSSTDPESPGSVEGWLDSRRNTIESRMSRIADDLIEDEYKESVEERDKNIAESSEAVDSGQPGESIDDKDVKRKTAIESGISKLKSESVARSSLESDVSSLCGDTSVASDVSRTVRKYLGSRTAELALRGSDSVDSNDTCGDDVTTTSGSRTVDRKYRGSRASDLSLRAGGGESIDSNDTCDSWERTGSSAASDFSRQNTESRSVITQSSASLASWSDCSKDIRFADRRMARCDGRSSSEETNSPRANDGAVLVRQKVSDSGRETVEKKDNAGADATLSGSTSQDSLTSESGGGSLTVHCFYHVFSEGELNRLIDECVGNLHIISSYYDHSNWCVIAEKVQVWTI